MVYSLGSYYFEEDFHMRYRDRWEDWVNEHKEDEKQTF